MDEGEKLFNEMDKEARNFQEKFLSGFIKKLVKRLEKELIHGESDVNLKEK